MDNPNAVALNKEQNAENDDKDDEDDLHPKAEMEMEWRR